MSHPQKPGRKTGGLQWFTAATDCNASKPAVLEGLESSLLASAEREGIVPLLNRLRTSNPVRRSARAVLDQEPLHTIQPLLKALTNPSAARWRERKVAAWTLGQADLDSRQKADAVVALLKVLEGDLPTDPGRYGRLLVRWVLGVLLISCVCTIVPLPEMLPSILITVVVFGMPVWSMTWDDNKINHVRTAAATALGRLVFQESVASLARAFHENSTRMRAATNAALHRVLPTLTLEHYGQLEAETVHWLCRALKEADDSLQLLLLEALEKVGDGRATPFLKQIAAEGTTPALRAAAHRALEAVLERQQWETESRVLLRGTEAPAPPAGQLLRPAASDPITEVSQLLRPTDDTHSP